jgi:hypothetical protein
MKKNSLEKKGITRILSCKKAKPSCNFEQNIFKRGSTTNLKRKSFLKCLIGSDPYNKQDTTTQENSTCIKPQKIVSLYHPFKIMV